VTVVLDPVVVGTQNDALIDFVLYLSE
jgi:hypothetical protein